jgi:hypothetical protein
VQQLSLCARRKEENSHINLERNKSKAGNLSPGNLAWQFIPSS